MSLDVRPIQREHIAGWRAAVEAVAAERIYLGRITLPPHSEETAFPLLHIANGWPMFVALTGNAIVGWADVTPVDIPECAHRGILGMGLLAPFRGQGLGERLLHACITQAPHAGLSKIELTVFSANARAITLYRKAGFAEIGFIRDYRRVDGTTYDAVLMERLV
jgi:RimJ/RimL family protein N-acetyltransferase